MKTYDWKLKDIIMVGFISIIFGVIYLGTVYFGVFAGTLLAPFGLSPLANEFVYGVWFMASTLAVYIIQKPGVAIVAEVLAALLEVLMGNMYGPMVIVSGIIQGSGAEAAFAATGYKKFNMFTMCLGAAGSCIASFVWGYFRTGFKNISPVLLIGMFVIRLVSSVVFAGVLCKTLGDKLAKTGLLKSYELGKKANV